MIEKIKNMSKVELHLHLDGSVCLETASKLSGISIQELKDKMIAKDKCKDLGEYLTKFDLPINLMQTEENLELIAKDLVDNLERQNVIYAEIRFAPMFHINKGLTYEQVINSVLKGINSNKNIQTNLILCLMRGMPKQDNLKTIEVASKYLNKGVCAIDLAGDEGKYPIDEYLDMFEIAKQKGIPFTIHAGESGSSTQIEKAIKIGARRIGHGIRCIEDEKVVELIKQNNVLLEICPTSNVQTNNVNKYEEHPVYELYKQGVLICINTDNITVSNLSLTQEYIKLIKNFDFSIEDLKQMNIYAIKGAFISDMEREKLIQKL